MTRSFQKNIKGLGDLVLNAQNTTLPDRPSIEPAPSSTDPTIDQRWWVCDLGSNKAMIIDEHCFTVAGSMDEDTARHIVQVHNKSIGV
jgi:hypothetical protein